MNLIPNIKRNEGYISTVYKDSLGIDTIGYGFAIKDLELEEDICEMILERKNACKKSGKIFGIKNYTFLDFPDMKLDSIPHLEINKELEKVVSKFNPKIVYSPPLHDLNNDHRLVFNSALVATRHFSSSVKQLLSYKCPGPVKHTFRPTIYQNIEKEFSYKLKAFKMYKSEVMKFPHLR